MVEEALVCPLLSLNRRCVRSGRCQRRQRGFPCPPSPGTRVAVVDNPARCVLYQHYLLVVLGSRETLDAQS